jgi:hypothetical protein
MNVMATNATTIKDGACWYGIHVGCLNTNNQNCTKCAERLAHAVNSTLGPQASAWVQSVDAARADTRIGAGLSIHQLLTPTVASKPLSEQR